MRFHRLVRGLMRRLSTAALVALLVSPAIAPAPRLAHPEQPVSSQRTDGLAPRPATAPSLELAVAPTCTPTPPALEVQRPHAGCYTVVRRPVADGRGRGPLPRKAAPAVLRL